MAGMKFLNLKGWHPSNARNQKRIWIAEQKAQQQAQAERDAAAEVRKHREAQQFQALAAAHGDAESARRSEQMQVGFLYAPPPGLEKVDEKVQHDATEDDAVREFRRKMEKRSAPASADDARRPLERYVGRRPDEMLTIKEQVERFPFLKDAPVEGDYAANVKVNFQPMGRTLRNVKCMRCGEWGHQSGDRECALRDTNPHDASRQAREDPLAIVAQLKQQGQLVLRQRALPREMQATGGGPEYEILLSDDESADAEKAYLAGLSTKEKKALLKKLRKQSKKKSHRRDDSSSDESSSSSDSREDRSSKKRKRKKTKHEKPEEKRRDRTHRRNDEHDEDETTGKRHRPSRHDRSVSRSRSRSRTRERTSHRHNGDSDRRRSRSRSRSPHRHRRR